MITEKKLGIWMDHSSAHLSEYSTEPIVTILITSNFTHQDKEISVGKGENLMHNKEQHRQSEYYKKIGEVIKKYDDVLLFGPTDAKVELFNTLKTNHLFSNIKIELMQTDKMSEYQQHAFVKDYFNKSDKE